MTRIITTLNVHNRQLTRESNRGFVERRLKDKLRHGHAPNATSHGYPRRRGSLHRALFR